MRKCEIIKLEHILPAKACLRCFLILFVLSFFCVVLVFTQNGQLRIGTPPIKNFPKQEYKGGTQNWNIDFGSEDNLIYVANNEGLLIYDGKNWRKHPLPNYSVLRSVKCAYMENKIYVGGQNEFGFFKPDSFGRLSYSSLVKALPQEWQSFEDVWKILCAGPNEQFFVTQRAIFHFTNGKAEVLTFDYPVTQAFFTNAKLYIHLQNYGLCVLQQNGAVLIPGGELVSSLLVTGMEVVHGKTIIASDKGGLFLLNKQKMVPWNVPLTPFLRENRIYCTTVLDYGPNTQKQYLVIGTTHNGFLVLDTTGTAMLHVNKPKGLQNNTVLSLKGQYRLLWVGLDNGIDAVETGSMYSLIKPYSGVEGTAYAAISHQNQLFLGTNQGLFVKSWESLKDPMNEIPFRLVNGTKGQVWSLSLLDNQLWMGHHEGAFIIDNKQAIQQSDIKGAWKFMSLKSFPGYALEGTYEGFILMKRVNNAWKVIKKLPGFSESARVFEEDSMGNIWVSHGYKGIYRLTLSNDMNSFREIRFYNSKDGLPGDIALQVDKVNEELIFSTPKGVYSYIARGDSFTPHPTFQHILGPGKKVNKVWQPFLNSIWYATDSEFGSISLKDEEKYPNLSFPYNLVGGFEFFFSDTIHLDNSTLFATEDGFVHGNFLLDPDLNLNSLPYPLIRSVNVSGARDSVLFQGNKSHVDKGAIATGYIPSQPYSLPAQFNSIKFTFSAPYSGDTRPIQYQYLLQGFESQWSSPTTHTQKEYTNLKSGSYTFKLRVLIEGADEQPETAYSFTISPPWYASGVAKGSYLTFLVLLVVGLIRFNQKKLASQEEELQEEKRQALKQQEEVFREEVEKTEAELIKLRNEKLRNEVSHKNKELASATMHLVQKNEILTDIKSKLKKLSQAVEATHRPKVKELIKAIDEDIRLDNAWEQFEQHFDQVHENFLRRLRDQYPQLTPKDLRLCAYLRMNLATKEIAPLLNISVRGVEISRYRLRKKLNIEKETNLVEFMQAI